MNKKIFAPKLYPLDRDIEKRWFIKYRDEKGNFQKVYGDLQNYTTVAERLKASKRLLRSLLEPEEKASKLRKGLVKALSELLEFKKPFLEKKSYQTYFSLLNVFARWYNVASAKDKQVCPSGIVAHLYSEGYAANYIRKMVVMLKGFFTVLVKQRKYSSNPFEDVVVKKIKGLSKLPFNKAQKAALRSLIEAADKQLWLACELEYYCFLRPKEIRLLKLSDFDSNAVLWIRSEVAKDDDAAPVIIPKQLQKKITALKKKYPVGYYLFAKNGEPGTEILSTNNLNDRHRVYVKALNLGDRYSLYSWTHTGIKEAALSGLPIKFLQQQKRHHSLDMFNEYLKDLTVVEDCMQMQNNFPTL